MVDRVPRPRYIVLATHSQCAEPACGRCVREAAEKLAEETGATIVTTMHACPGSLEQVARRFPVHGPDDARVATLLVEGAHERELLILAAVKLYEMGVSSGAAAELAGISRVELLHALARYRICPFQAELEELRAKDA